MKRDIHKRIDLSDEEAYLLRVQAKQCNMTEAEFVRELILRSQPTEAPPKQFYIEMENINKIGTNINQIAAKANSCGYVEPEDIRLLEKMHKEVIEHMVEIKNIVFARRRFYYNAYERYQAQVDAAKAAGRKPPDISEANILPDKNLIEDPGNDPDLGWNYLGVIPPYLDGVEDGSGGSEE